MTKQLQQNEKQAIIRLYNEGNSLHKISKLKNFSRPTIRKILRNANIRNVSKSDIDHSDTIKTCYFDNINNEETAYFLGLLYADGNVYINKKRNSYSISINLIESDRLLLEKLRDRIAPEHKLYFVNQRHIVGHGQWALRMQSEILAKSLIKNGCEPRKSLTLEFPKHIPNYLLHHFIRGYFDGDGCICAYKHKNDNKNYVRFCISFAGTKMFLGTLAPILGIFLKSTPPVYIKKNKNDINAELTIGGNQQVYRLMTWLYKDATIFLKRKHEKYLDLQQEIAKYY